MTVVFITPEFISEKETFDGGLSNYLFRISKSLIIEGHTPIVITRSFTENRVLTFEGIEVHRVMIVENTFIRVLKTLTLNQINSSIDYQYMSWVLNGYLRKNLQNIKPDIIQYSSYTGTAFYRLKDIPSVARISSYEKFLRIAKGITKPSKNDLRVEWLENQALSKVDAIFGPSNLTAKAVKDDLNLDVTIIETPFLLDGGELNDTIFRDKLVGKDYLLYFGSLSKVKGVHIIGMMLEKLLEMYPTLHFVFVGKDIGVKDEIFQRIKRYAERVIFFEPMPHSTLYPIIENAKGVVLPSLSDNFPNTCIEAMALGKVVIGTKGTSFEQLINDGLSGFLAKPGDPNDLLKVIQKVLELNDSEINQISEKAKNRIKLLKPDLIVRQLLKFYEESIGSFKQKK